MNDPIAVVRIPMERVPVLVGKGGSTKKMIETNGGVSIRVDSQSGEVYVFQKNDPLQASIAPNVIRAIGRGFSAERAVALYENESQLAVIPLREFAKSGSHRIEEIKGRIIGKSGRTRNTIEELTDTYISIYGDSVSVIGDHSSLYCAVEAIRMLINGRKHRTVYQYLEKFRHDQKFRKMSESFG